jgi:hypothetical protein
MPGQKPATVSASGADLTGILSWLTPEFTAHLNPWGEHNNASPGP